MCKSNGFKYPDYPDYPDHLPELNSVEERLISPRLPFLQIRRFRHYGCYKMIGQIINVEFFDIAKVLLVLKLSFVVKV